MVLKSKETSGSGQKEDEDGRSVREKLLIPVLKMKEGIRIREQREDLERAGKWVLLELSERKQPC